MLSGIHSDMYALWLMEMSMQDLYCELQGTHQEIEFVHWEFLPHYKMATPQCTLAHRTRNSEQMLTWRLIRIICMRIPRSRDGEQIKMAAA